MQPLAELQGRIAAALLEGSAAPLAAELPGAAARARFGIHLRNYDASLLAALRDKFSACAWLVGAELFEAAAHAFMRAHPPRRPCIAEYGAELPQFLATFGRAVQLPYLQAFAELEWAMGNVAITVDSASLGWDRVASVGTERLIDAAVALQPGLRYLRATSRVDELMAIYLQAGVAPAVFELSAAPAHLEVRGARGAVSIAVLDSAEHVFRAALAAGRTIGDGAEQAVERDGTFDAGAALRRLVHSGLVTQIHHVPQGDRP